MMYIANLNGTILCPYQLLLDLAEQLPNSPAHLKNLAFMPICDLNSTNDWINLESLGKPVALRAKQITDVIVALLKQQHTSELHLAVHTQQGKLSADNLYGLLFLAEAMSSLQLTCYVADAQSQSALQTTLLPLLAKDNVNIEFKIKSEVAQTELLTVLASKRLQVINSLGFTFDEQFLTENPTPEFKLKQLIGFSWLCLKSGGYDIACSLLELAQLQNGLSTAMQEQLFMHLLMIRFFSHQYALVTAADFPTSFSTLEPSEIRSLQFLKAYSATLSRNLTVAQAFFTQCGISETMALSDETSLYQMNLFALSKVIQGDTDTAFALEFRIKEHIAAQGITTVGLKYVNFINIARLYKKTQAYDLSLDYYNQAYNEISGGGYATSDHIYYNMNLGSLFEAARKPAKALLYWLKAAMHWLACPNHYALSWRPRLILCQETLADVVNPLPVAKAYAFFVGKLNELLAVNHIALNKSDSASYLFVEDNTGMSKEQCYIHSNVVFYTSDKGSNINPAATSELAALVSRCLQTIVGVPEQNLVVLVDTQLDSHLVQSPEEALAFAGLSACKACYFNGNWHHAADFSSLKAMRASLSKGIHSIATTDKGLAVEFKRSFLNKTLLEQAEISWVNQLQQTSSLSLANATAQDWAVVNKLAKKRIVNFSYSE